LRRALNQSSPPRHGALRSFSPPCGTFGGERRTHAAPLEGRMEAVGLGIEALAIHHDRTEVLTSERTQFIDLTPWVARCLQRSGIDRGVALVRVLHTTAAVVVNENEPL